MDLPPILAINWEKHGIFSGIYWVLDHPKCSLFEFPRVGVFRRHLLGLARSNCFQTFRRPKSSWRTLAGMGPKGPKMTPKSSRLIRLISVNWLETGRYFPMKQWNQDAEKDLEQKNQELTASSQAHWGFFGFWTVPDRACFMFFFSYVFLDFYIFFWEIRFWMLLLTMKDQPEICKGLASSGRDLGDAWGQAVVAAKTFLSKKEDAGGHGTLRSGCVWQVIYPLVN